MADQPPSDGPAFVNGGDGDKPRFRMAAGQSNERLGIHTVDSISNFVSRLGISQPNQLAASTYDFHPISRIAQLLEWAYRGSWIIGAACDVPADDMTRMGVEFSGDTAPDELEKLRD